MSNIKKNIIANYAGKIWATVINIAFVPFYIKYIGIEAYGLVGVFATIQPLMTILDMGMSPSISRELARYSALPGQEQNMRNLVRTLELIYWGIAALLFIIVLALAPLTVSHWFTPQKLPVSIINQSVVLMGLALVLQWPVGFYSGGLIGLQKQVIFNVFNAIMWTLRGFGALLVVMLSSNPVLAFFWWQLLMSIINVFGIATLLWRSLLPSPGPAQFRKDILQSIWRFAFGMGSISVIILIFNQLDKIILSSKINLSMFGYYSVVWQVVGSLFLLYYPIYVAFSPVITQLYAQRDFENIKITYQKGRQFMSVAVFPVSVVLAIFSKEILFIWTGDTIITENCYLLLSIITVGATFNGLFYMPYSMSQAYGQTKHLLYIFISILVAYIPLVYLGIRIYGVYGAAIAFTVVSVIQQGIVNYVTHRHFFLHENIKWFFDDIGRPLFVAFITAAIAKYIINWPLTGIFGLFTILGIYIVTLTAAALITPFTRVSINKCFFNR